MNDIEKKALQENMHDMPYGKNRRFACAFNLEKWMDEMVVEIRADFNKENLNDDQMMMLLQSSDLRE